MKYCASCGQNVNTTKKFSFGWFLFNCLWIIGGGVYLLYWILVKKKTCSKCNGNQLEGEREVIDCENDTPMQLALSKLKHWDANSEQSPNDDDQKLRMRQTLVQQKLKSVEHREECKRDLAKSKAKCEASKAARRSAAEQRELGKEQKQAAKSLGKHLSKVKTSSH